MAKTRTCILCKNKYEYCPTCPKDKDKAYWNFVLCSEDCKTVNEILSAHTAGKIETVDAKEKLSNIDIEKMDIKDEDNKKHIEEIMSYSIEFEIKEVPNKKKEK